MYYGTPVNVIWERPCANAQHAFGSCCKTDTVAFVPSVVVLVASPGTIINCLARLQVRHAGVEILLEGYKTTETNSIAIQTSQG